MGWAVADRLGAELPCLALERALGARRPPAGLLYHSDRGVKYACDEYQALLAQNGLAASLSGVGSYYDTAVVEGFVSSLKTALVHHEAYATRAQTQLALFEYIELF